MGKTPMSDGSNECDGPHRKSSRNTTKCPIIVGSLRSFTLVFQVLSLWTYVISPYLCWQKNEECCTMVVIVHTYYLLCDIHEKIIVMRMPSVRISAASDTQRVEGRGRETDAKKPWHLGKSLYPQDSLGFILSLYFLIMSTKRGSKTGYVMAMSLFSENRTVTSPTLPCWGCIGWSFGQVYWIRRF